MDNTAHEAPGDTTSAAKGQRRSLRATTPETRPTHGLTFHGPADRVDRVRPCPGTAGVPAARLQDVGGLFARPGQLLPGGPLVGERLRDVEGPAAALVGQQMRDQPAAGHHRPA